MKRDLKVVVHKVDQVVVHKADQDPAEIPDQNRSNLPVVYPPMEIISSCYQEDIIFLVLL